MPAINLTSAYVETLKKRRPVAGRFEVQDKKTPGLTIRVEPRRTAMPRKRHKPEEIVAKLRQVDVLVSQGQSVADAIRSIGVTEVTYYRWRQEFGGLKSDQVKRLKDLETENTRLRRAIADLTLDKLILQEAARGNF